MGIKPIGIFLDFDCETFENVTLTGTAPPSNVSATPATVTLLVNPNNIVWLTGYVTWVASRGNQQLRFEIIRDDNEVICTAEDTSGPANTPNTTALTCCDEDPSPGERTYRLVVTALDLPAMQTVTLNEGTLTGAVIAN